MTALQCATTLVVARHAEAEYEVSEWVGEGGSLTPLGRRQAAELGESLAGRRVAHVWTSTLARAVQTAEIVAGRLGVGVTTRAGLREPAIDVGVPDPEPADVEPLLRTYQRWREGDLDVRTPGSESGREIADRVAAVLREVADAHPGETVLVVSHGVAIGLGVPHVARMTVEWAPLDSCQSVEVSADADAWVCTRWGRTD
jgi:broad specificity phosphatase PhoE